MLLLGRRSGIGLVNGSRWWSEEEWIERVRAGNAFGSRPSFRGLGEALGIELSKDLLRADASTFAGGRQYVAHFLLNHAHIFQGVHMSEDFTLLKQRTFTYAVNFKFCLTKMKPFNFRDAKYRAEHSIVGRER